MSSNFDRYRNLKEKGRLTPRGGAAAVTFSTVTNFAPTRPKLNHRPGQMELASAYREPAVELETPQLSMTQSATAEEDEHNIDLSSQETATNSQGTSASRATSKLTPTSLFDPARQQRYGKFKNRVRLSQTPRSSPPAEQRDDEHNRHVSFAELTAPDPPPQNGNDATSNLATIIRPPSLNKNQESKSQNATKKISPTQRSAFKTPRSFARRIPLSPSSWSASSPSQTSSSNDDLPGPPSIAAISNAHRMNQVGLPIASARHETPRNYTSNHDPPTLSSISTTPLRKTPPLREYATPSPQIVAQQSSDLDQMETKQTKNRPPPGIHFGARRLDKPQLAVNPVSTPTAKPPPLDYASAVSSFDPDMVVVSVHPSPGTSTKSLEASSQTTTSLKGRRDRVAEAREGQDSPSHPPSTENTMRRPPLAETSRPPMYHASNRQSPALTVELRPSLEIPSLLSNYSSDTGKSSNDTPTKGYRRSPIMNNYSSPASNGDQTTENKGVSPVDFYRRIAAERTRQASFAKQYTQKTPSASTPPATKRSLTPTFRSVTPIGSSSPPTRQLDSPISLPNYQSDAFSRRVPSFPTLDQRTVRILYAKEFDRMIEEHTKYQTKDFLRRYSRGTPNRNPDELALYARKRPLLDEEADNRDFDVINAETGNANAMVVYATSMLADLQTKDIEAKLHEFDHVFSEFNSGEDVYDKLARPEVVRAQAGGSASIVIFGHSDSGKTHTMQSIEERAVHDLFSTVQGSVPRYVSVQFMELVGDQIVDLLGTSVDDAIYISEEAGLFRIQNSIIKKAGNPRELLRILSNARRLLMRSSTDRTYHGYLLCQFQVTHNWTTGHLQLLECPGSELTTENGPSSTLKGLMDRIRTKAEGRIQKCPFRGLNTVTKAMQSIFDDPMSKISVLATVSPAASATEDALSALKILNSIAPVHMMTQKEDKLQTSRTVISVEEDASPRSTSESSDDLLLPRQWNRDEFIEWMARKHLLGENLPYEIDGRKAMRMTKHQLQDTFYSPSDYSKADRLHRMLRVESDRVARIRVKARMAQERDRASATMRAF